MEFMPFRNNTLHLRAMDSRLPSTWITSPPHRQGHIGATVPSTITSMCGLTLVTDYTFWLKARKPIQPHVPPVVESGWEREASRVKRWCQHYLLRHYHVALLPHIPGLGGHVGHCESVYRELNEVKKPPPFYPHLQKLLMILSQQSLDIHTVSNWFR